MKARFVCVAIGVMALTGCGALRRWTNPLVGAPAPADVTSRADHDDDDDDDDAGRAATGGQTAARVLQFNGRPATAQDLEVVALVEQATGRRLPDGAYWYDPACGAAGVWGGATLGFLRAGLPLGGRLPANASGGGDGRLSGVFVNGREIPPQDRAELAHITGRPILPGRYFVDASGAAGFEGGSPLVNLFQMARAQRRGAASGGDTYYNKSGDNSVFAAPGCVSVRTSSTGSSSADTTAIIGCD